VHPTSVRITRVRAARDVQRQRLRVLRLCAIGDHPGLVIATLAEGCWMRPDVSGDSGFEASDEDCVSAAVQVFLQLGDGPNWLSPLCHRNRHPYSIYPIDNK
jgi:hypothetical protein